MYVYMDVSSSYYRTDKIEQTQQFVDSTKNTQNEQKIKVKINTYSLHL